METIKEESAMAAQPYPETESLPLKRFDAEAHGRGNGETEAEGTESTNVMSSFGKLFEAINLVNSEVMRRGGEGVPELKKEMDRKAWKEAQLAVKTSVGMIKGGKEGKSNAKEIRALEVQLATEKKAAEFFKRGAKKREEELVKTQNTLSSKLDRLRNFVAAGGDLWLLRTSFGAWRDEKHAVALETMTTKADHLNNLVEQLRKVRHERSQEMLQHWQREGPWQIASAILIVWKAEADKQTRIRLSENLAAEMENQRLRLQKLIDNAHIELENRTEELAQSKAELEATNNTLAQTEQELEATRQALAEAQEQIVRERAAKDAALTAAAACWVSKRCADQAALAAQEKENLAREAEKDAKQAETEVRTELESKKEIFENAEKYKRRADQLAERVNQTLSDLAELQKSFSDAADTIEVLKMEVDRLREQGWFAFAEAETARAEMRVYAAVVTKMQYRQDQMVESFKKDLLFRDVRIEHLQLNLERVEMPSTPTLEPLPPLDDSPKIKRDKIMDGIPEKHKFKGLPPRRGQNPSGLKVLPSIQKASLVARRMASPRGPQRMASPRGPHRMKDVRGGANKTWHAALPLMDRGRE